MLVCIYECYVFMHLLCTCTYLSVMIASMYVQVLCMVVCMCVCMYVFTYACMAFPLPLSHRQKFTECGLINCVAKKDCFASDESFA
jgi:hypothetical protein